MRRLLAILCAALLVSTEAGSTAISLTGAGQGTAVVAATYVGPGDIVASATAWYGLRCYNAAKASAAQAINVRRASDNTSQDVGLTAACALNVTSANSFATQDATCTGTIASTTLTCVSASSTPHAGSTLTGAGLVQPSYIVSCGAFAGGAGTCTLNAAQTVSVGETITMQYGLYVTKWYDQSGNTNDAAQSTAAKQPQLLPTCLGTNPCLAFIDSAAQALATSGSLAAIPQPATASIVAQPQGLSGIRYAYLTNGAAPVEWAWHGTGFNQIYGGSGFFQSASFSVSVWHAMQGLVNGASSVWNIDGAETTPGINPGTSPTSNAALNVGNAGAGTSQYLGFMAEVGMWPSGFSSGNRTSVCRNEQAYYTAGNFGAAC